MNNNRDERKWLTGVDSRGVYALPAERDAGSGVTVLRGNGVCDYEHLIRRLAEYEEADRNGRLVHLPCSVGDMVYEVWYAPCQYGATYPYDAICDDCPSEVCNMRKMVYRRRALSIDWIIRIFGTDGKRTEHYYLDEAEAEKEAREWNEANG